MLPAAAKRRFAGYRNDAVENALAMHAGTRALGHHELHESIEQPAFVLAQSGRFCAKRSRPGCSS